MFDGDELNMMIMCDLHQYQSFKRMGTYASVLDYKKPWTLSGKIGISKQLTSTVANWLENAPRTRPLETAA